MGIQIKLNEGDVERAVEVRRLAEGKWFALAVKSLGTQVSEKNGNLILKVTYAPLTDPENPDTSTTPLHTDRMTLPIRNIYSTNEAGELLYPYHEPPNTEGLVRRALQAIYGEDEIPSNPRNVDGSLVYKGELIDSSEYEECKKEAASICLAKLVELFNAAANDENPIKDYVVFGLMKHVKPENSDLVFVNFEDIQPELPEEAVLVTDKSEFTHKG